MTFPNQLHVYAQAFQHEPVRIVGTPRIILQLAKELNEAYFRSQTDRVLLTGDDGSEWHAQLEVISSDGEAYDVLIRVTDGEDDFSESQYIDRSANGKPCNTREEDSGTHLTFAQRQLLRTFLHWQWHDGEEIMKKWPLVDDWDVIDAFDQRKREEWEA